MSYYFTSESVSEGHPDKVCDQISDAVLDAVLKDDPNGRVACECYAATGLVVVGGEISTSTFIDIPELARQVISDIGYTKAEYRFDSESCAVINVINRQSPDIAAGVDTGGAGDQGMMFGYACRETPELMPAALMYSHKIVQELARLRRLGADGPMPWLRPDAKSQVTLEYNNDGSIKRVDAVVVSTQHDPGVKHADIVSATIEQVIRKIIPAELLDDDTKFHVNPTGIFVLGGPHADTGLTGRKIIVDTYGGKAPHGGGAFSGKDPTKVDRSAAYAARHLAKNVVAANVADECTIQLSYAIGVADPVSIFVDTHGTGKVGDQQIAQLIRGEIDLTPAGIINRLELMRPIYRASAAYGHFGREEFPWEQLNLVDKFTTLV